MNEDHSTFAERGIICLKRRIPQAKTFPAKKFILEELKRLRIREDGKWHSKQFDSVPSFQVTTHIGQRLKHHAVFDKVIPEQLVTYVQELADGARLKPQPAPQILVTPPQKGDWSVPHLGWHVDVHAPSQYELPGIQLFVLLDDVAPQGGGTMAVTGYHRLHQVQDGNAHKAQQILRQDPIYAALFEPMSERSLLLEPHWIAGVKLQVIEMTGQAGDVYVMDMRILHAPSLNASKNARMMLTHRYLK